MRSLGLKVPREEGEQVRKKLSEMGLLDVSLKVKRSDDSILFPIMSADLGEIDHQIVEDDFEERKAGAADYSRLVEVPEELRELLPTSFDIIGDVAIIKLPEELLAYAREVGTGLCRAFPRLRSVALDKGVKGETRVRELEVIAGDENTETTHTEFGIRLLVDPARAYFNPRLANERMRVASLVRDGEIVLDMFAGVGPFSIMIAKHARPSVVYAIDINPEAVFYMRRNVELNRADRVIAIEGDAREVIFDLPNVDRVVMNLPHSAIDYFADALTRLNFGGAMHLYHICDRNDIDGVVDKLLVSAKGMGVEVELIRKEEMKTYSPSMSVYSVDLLLRKWS